MGFFAVRNGKITQGLGGTFDGSKDMGDLSNWRILSSDANDIVKGSYQLLTERSATLYHTYPAVRGAVNKQVEYGIGPGLVFRSQPDAETIGQSKDWAVGWGKEFQKVVDYYFRSMNFYEKQSVMFRTAMYIGDSLLFFLREDGMLNDLIEASGDQINPYYTRENYTLGIKHDEWLRREGFMKVDGKPVSFRDSNGDQNALQFYNKELSRQLRGYPLAYSIINLARNDDTHTDAITHRAVMESILMAIFKGRGTDLDKQAKNLADRNKKARGEGVETNIFKRMRSKMGPGNIMTMNTDEELTFTDLKTPSNTFGDFKKWILNYACMAMGTPPEVALSEYSTSFTAHKGALNDFVKSYMKKRRSYERNTMDVVIREIAKTAIMRGEISAPGFFEGSPMVQAAYLRGMYLGPVPGHINPFVEVRAEELAVKNAFKLRSDVASMNGYEWDAMVEEWAQEQERFTASPQNYAEKVAKTENVEVVE